MRTDTEQSLWASSGAQRFKTTTRKVSEERAKRRKEEQEREEREALLAPPTLPDPSEAVKDAVLTGRSLGPSSPQHSSPWKGNHRSAWGERSEGGEMAEEPTDAKNTDSTKPILSTASSLTVNELRSTSASAPSPSPPARSPGPSTPKAQKLHRVDLDSNSKEKAPTLRPAPDEGNISMSPEITPVSSSHNLLRPEVVVKSHNRGGCHS